MRERDLKPGLDVTPLAAVSQQNIQDLIAFAECAPNKAIVIVDKATPDVINNPRYVRYLWFDLNFNTLKYFNGSSWQPIGGGTGGPVTGTINIDQINKGSGVNGSIFRIHPTTGILEFAPLDNILTVGTINLSALKLTGGSNGSVMMIVGGVASWNSVNSIVALVLNALTNIDPNKLSGRLPDTILYSNVFSEAEWIDLLTFFSFWPTGVLPLRFLNTSGATDGQVIRFNSVSGLPEWGVGIGGGIFTKQFVGDSVYSRVILGNIYTLPALNPFGGIPYTPDLATLDTDDGIFFQHNLGVTPKVTQVTVVIPSDVDTAGSREVPIDTIYAIKTDASSNTYLIPRPVQYSIDNLLVRIQFVQGIARDTAINQSEIYYFNPVTRSEQMISRKTNNFIRVRLYA